MGYEISRGTGPEPTKYDRRRHESMRLRDVPYGFFRTGSPIPVILCGYCHLSMPEQHMIVENVHMHNECFSEAMRATST